MVGFVFVSEKFELEALCRCLRLSFSVEGGSSEHDGRERGETTVISRRFAETSSLSACGEKRVRKRIRLRYLKVEVEGAA